MHKSSSISAGAHTPCEKAMENGILASTLNYVLVFKASGSIEIAESVTQTRYMFDSPANI
jgi:hypothetical protein